MVLSDTRLCSSRTLVVSLWCHHFKYSPCVTPRGSSGLLPPVGQPPRHVVAGGEGAAGAGEDDSAHTAVGIGLVERLMQFRFQWRAERVERLGR
ncbi:MAG: hypothetical protein U0531_04425 [Dehalococcoidia bacterium]